MWKSILSIKGYKILRGSCGIIMQRITKNKWKMSADGKLIEK